MECNPALFFVVLNIVFVANYFSTLKPIHLLLKGHNGENLIIWAWLAHHFFNVIDRKIYLIEIENFLLRVEQPELSHNSLMPCDDMELRFIFDRSFVEAHFVDV